MAVIDVGPGATNRGDARSERACVDLNNPANDTGSLDTMEFWYSSNGSGVKCGTFYGSSTKYTSRDYETIGSVTSGAKRTFTGLSCDVTATDFLGAYWTSGNIESDTSGYLGVYSYTGGDPFGAGEITYSLLSGDAISIYATGATPSVYEESAAIAIGFRVTATPTMNLLRTATTKIGLLATATKALDLSRSSTIKIGLLPTASRIIEISQTASIAIGHLVTASCASIREAAIALGLSVSASKSFDLLRSATVKLGLTATASRIIEIEKAATIAIGHSVTATKAIEFSRTAATAIGLSVTATRALIFSVEATIAIGLSVWANLTLIARVSVKTVRLMAIRSIEFAIKKRDTHNGVSKKDVEIGL